LYGFSKNSLAGSCLYNTRHNFKRHSRTCFACFHPNAPTDFSWSRREPTSLIAGQFWRAQLKLMQFSGCQKPLLLKITHESSYLIDASLCLTLSKSKRRRTESLLVPNAPWYPKEHCSGFKCFKASIACSGKSSITWKESRSLVELFSHVHLCKYLVHYIRENTMHFY
jgi:hypothetical protein